MRAIESTFDLFILIMQTSLFTSEKTLSPK